MKNNKIFSKKLFLDGISQTRVPGLVSIILTLFVFMNDYFVKFNSSAPEYNSKAVIYAFAIYVPMFMIWLFRPLFKRSSSDFFDSLGVKKTTLAVSYLAAVVFWTTISLIIGNFFDMLFVIRTGVFEKEWQSVVTWFLYSFVGCLQTSAIWLTAVAITGKLCSCIFSAVTMTYLPQFIFGTVFAFINRSNEAFSVLFTGNFLSERLNIASQPIFYLILYFYEPTPKAADLIYSLVLFAIYLALGIFLLSKRPSETAGKTSVNKWLSALIPALFSLFAAVFGLSLNFGTYERKVRNFGWIFIIVGLIIYFVFYFVLQKKSVKIKPLLAGFVSFSLCSAIIFGSAYLSAANLSSKTLNQDDITSVNYYTHNNDEVNGNLLVSNIYSSHLSVKKYFSYKMSQIDFTDNKLKSYFTDFSKLCVNSSDMAFNDQYFDNYYFKVNTKFKSYYLFSTQKALMYYVDDTLMNDERVKKIFTDLPKFEDLVPGSISLNTFNFYDSKDFKPTQSRAKELYNSLCREAMTVDFNLWKSYVLTSEESFNSHFCKFNAKIKVDGKTLDFSLPINETTPKTIQKYLDMSNELQSDLKNEALNGDYELLDLHRKYVNSSNSNSYLISEMSDKDKKEIVNYLKSVKNDPILSEYDYYYVATFKRDKLREKIEVYFPANYNKMSVKQAELLNNTITFGQ